MKTENEADVLVGVKGVTDLFEEKEEKGLAQISQLRYEEPKDILGNMRYMMDGQGFMIMVTGNYTRLVVDGTLMMSDTRMERLTNKHFIQEANGDVMIAGLGIGLVIRNIIDKPEVRSVTVYEKYQDVIELVGPKLQHPKLRIVQADILEYKPAKDELYDVIYFDIWPEISQDNLDDIRVLHNRWKNRLNRANPKAFMDSWMKDYLRKERAKDNRSSWGW